MMRQFLTRASVVTFFISPVAYAQAGSADFPSISAEAGHLYLSNRTNDEVVFYLETANTNRTEHRLAANSSATYTGVPSDSWFNIYVYSNNQQVTYGLNAGTRHYFEWNQAGILDVYRMPAR